jgi:tetratricopeptide (TPR) repeat protein
LARTFRKSFFSNLKVEKKMNMRHFFFAILLIISGLSPVFAQSVKQYERAGEKAFNEKDYNAAIFYFGYVLSKDPKNLDVLYKYGDCAQKFYAFPIAEKSYLKIAKSKQKKEFPLLDFRLGEVKKAQGEYAAAKQYFKDFTLDGGLKSESAFTKRALSEADNCDWAMQRMAEADKTEVKPLGREINSNFADFGATMRGDTLFFSSYPSAVRKPNKLVADFLRTTRRTLRTLFFQATGDGFTLIFAKMSGHPKLIVKFGFWKKTKKESFKNRIDLPIRLIS